MQNVATFNPDESGTQLVTDLNNSMASLLSTNRGSTRPEYAVTGTMWVNVVSSSQEQLFLYDGAADILIGTYNPATHQYYPCIGGGISVMASASVTDLGAVPQAAINVTGSTTINSFGTAAPIGQIKFVTFTGILSLVYNSTSMILPGLTSITTAANDTASFIYLGSGNWQCLNYTVATNSISGSGFTTGDVKPTYKTIVDAGWVFANDQTIGSATSGAAYANANAQQLFTLFWNNVGFGYAPITGGYGGSAAADWAANRQMYIPKALGRTLASAGAGSGLSIRSLGQSVGDENMQQHNHSTNDPTHTHGALSRQSGSDGGSYIAASNNPDGYAQIQNSYVNISINPAGSGTGGNMQPTTFVNFMLKL